MTVTRQCFCEIGEDGGVPDTAVDTRRARLVRDRGLSAADADAMIAAQMPSAEKRARAHHVIDNTGDLAALDRAVDALWPKLGSP